MLILRPAFNELRRESRGSSLSYRVEVEFMESAQDYMSRTNLKVKVLDFVQLGGVDSTSNPSGFSIPSGVSLSLTTYTRDLKRLEFRHPWPFPLQS